MLMPDLGECPQVADQLAVQVFPVDVDVDAECHTAASDVGNVVRDVLKSAAAE